MANLALMIEMKSQETRELTIRRPVGQVVFKCERCGRTFIVSPTILVPSIGKCKVGGGDYFCLGTGWEPQVQITLQSYLHGLCQLNLPWLGYRCTFCGRGGKTWEQLPMHLWSHHRGADIIYFCS